uniref:Adenine-specific methyltransferase n=1 Tax=Siphoviridae sp. ctGz830 TaxID=2827825 RepID=A0A8S5TAA9_9CAUD|nr:MAG TPA: adenine-specific methyltransferase [Siphoviridae sp. ctGz830]
MVTLQTNHIYRGDCLELMKSIPDNSVDMILADLPYGIIKGLKIDGWKNNTSGWKNNTNWDVPINLNELFPEYDRICRENAHIVLFSQEPYTHELRSYSDVKSIVFSYPLIWIKNHFANALKCNKSPVSIFEDISVFHKKFDSYGGNELRNYFYKLSREFLNISTTKEINNRLGHSKADHCFRVFNSQKHSMQFKLCSRDAYNELINKLKINEYKDFKTYDELLKINNKYKKIFNLPKNKKVLKNVLEFKKDTQTSRLHPTQKPVALLEYLIKTYTNENDIVLDNVMGSGSTIVACINTNRQYIGIELNENYFNKAKNRIEVHKREICCVN